MESAMRMRSWFSLIFAAIMGTLAPLTEVTEEEIGEAGGAGGAQRRAHCAADYIQIVCPTLFPRRSFVIQCMFKTMSSFLIHLILSPVAFILLMHSL